MEKRKNENKNYWLGAFVTLLWWLVFVAILVFVDPEVLADYPLPETYGLLFLFLFMGVWFLSSLLLANKRRGVMVALVTVIVGYLQLWRLLNWINLLLLFGAVGALEYYYVSGKKKTS